MTPNLKSEQQLYVWMEKKKSEMLIELVFGAAFKKKK